MRKSFILLLAFFLCVTGYAQKLTISGVVIDKDLNEPLTGVNVLVKGTTTGTIPDLDGKYSLEVEPNSILVVSYIGYVSQQIPASGEVVNVTLKEDTQNLDEVVVVGYGTMRKSDLTGSISTAKGKDMLKAQSFNALDGLKGNVAGVNIFSNTGQPGGESRVIIRGISTINASASPLYVVDGVVMSNSDLLYPNDIESIEVLKEASSAAIYGARGANGVVMITTKKGTIGQPKIKYDGSFGIQHITKTIPMMDAYEFVKLQADRCPKDMETTYFMNYDGKKWGLEDYRNIPHYNWQDEIFRSAWMQSHNVSLTGGSEGVRYNASLSYYDQDGILLESNYKRVQGRMGTTIQKKKLKIYLTTNYSSTTTTGGSPSQNSYSGMNNLFYSVCGYRPVTEPDRPLNSLMDNIMDDAINNTNDYRFNPIMSLKNEYRKTYANYIQFKGFAEYEFIKGLKLKVSGGYTFDTRKGETFNNSKTR